MIYDDLPIKNLWCFSLQTVQIAGVCIPTMIIMMIIVTIFSAIMYNIYIYIHHPPVN